MNNIWILAATEETTTSGIGSEPVNSTEQTTSTVEQDPGVVSPEGETQAPKPWFGNPMIMIAIMAIAMYFLLFRGPRKKQQQQKKMIQEVKKNDRIRTIGGIIGTVIDVKDEEITLKVDESNNTKIKIVRTAIGTNLSSTKE